MTCLRRATVVNASFDRVWAFHSTIDGLVALTPEWMGVTVESVRTPANTDENYLVPGTEIELRMNPFGIAPASTWTASITERERDQNKGMFRDVSVDGPFDEWIHTHRFVDVGFGTLVYDQVDYRLAVPGFAPVLRPVLSVFFAYRHWRLARLLE